MKNRVLSTLLFIFVILSITGCFNKKGIENGLSPDLSKPQASVQAGQYDKSIDVAITTATKNDIYYTLDNTEPTKETGKKYEGPIKIEASTILKAVAVNSLNNASAVETWTYLIQGTVGDITIKENSIKDSTKKEIELIAKDDSTAIYYTTDGTEPTESSNLYTEKFQVSNTQIIKAIGTRTQFSNSKVSSLAINIPGTISNPKFNIADGQYETTQDITITSDTSGAKIYYTTDGTVPTKSSKLYVNPIKIDKTTIIKAIATKDGVSDSDVVRKNIFIVTKGEKNIIDLSKIKGIIVSGIDNEGNVTIYGENVPTVKEGDILLADPIGAMKIKGIINDKSYLKLSVEPLTFMETARAQNISFDSLNDIKFLPLQNESFTNFSNRNLIDSLANFSKDGYGTGKQLSITIDPFGKSETLKGIFELAVNQKVSSLEDTTVVNDPRWYDTRKHEQGKPIKYIEKEFANIDAKVYVESTITLKVKTKITQAALEELTEYNNFFDMPFFNKQIGNFYGAGGIVTKLRFGIDFKVTDYALGVPTNFSYTFTQVNTYNFKSRYDFATKQMIKTSTQNTIKNEGTWDTHDVTARLFGIEIKPNLRFEIGLGKIEPTPKGKELTLYSIGLFAETGLTIKAAATLFKTPLVYRKCGVVL